MTFAASASSQNFLFIGGGEPEKWERMLNSKIDGVQIIYNWKSLEKEKDLYTFDKIEKDLAFLQLKNRKLWVQLQDRFFLPTQKFAPAYILEDLIYQGGMTKQKDHPGEGLPLGSGWVTKQWNKEVRQRFQKLIEQLANRFDGKIYGINLPETATDIDIKTEEKVGFTCDGYFHAVIENIKHARQHFKKSQVVQYTNFFPCEWNNDRNYMSRFFEIAVKNQIGLGGPDVVPFKKTMMKNSYPFFNQYKGKLPFVAFAVQKPTRTHTNPKTKKKFTEKEFSDFAQDFLGANVIFWSAD